MATSDYSLMNDGFYRNVVDGTGPYVQTTPGTFALAATGSGGGGGGGGGDASAANQVTGNNSLAGIDGKTPALGQQLAAASSPVVLTAAQIATLTPPAAITGFATDASLGSLTETAPGTDTASSGLNGRLQRIAQRLTSLIALLPGLGTKTMAGSQAVTLATDDTQIGAKTTASALGAGGSGVIGWLSDAVTQLKTLVTNSPTQKTALPTETDSFSYTMNAPQKTFRCGFEAAVASGPDTTFFTAIASGSGMTIAQAAGSLTIASGTTTYAETILRSVPSFSGSLTLRYSMNLSQRIANQQFYLELVDVIGDALAFTVNSATSVTVTIPGTTLTSANVGQSMYLGALSLASCPGGKYVIASVAGTAITFTVAGFPGSGSGTCSVFGWNFHHIIYDGVTATTCLYDTGRNGYVSGETTATISTTASPGHLVTWPVRDSTSGMLDQLSASSVVLENTLRASRVRNVPEDTAVLRVQIRCINLASAPGSTTTLSIGFIEIENFVSQQVSIVNTSPLTNNAGFPVQVVGSFPSGANTIGAISLLANSTQLTPGVSATNLGKAEDAVAASGDTGVFILGVRRDVLAASASAAGDYNEYAVDIYGAQLSRSYEKQAKTYSASANIAAAASATDIAILPGNATTTVYVTEVIVSGIQTTAGIADVQLIKRSTANSGGTSSAMTSIPHDSTDAAASSAPLAYTANPTPGTAVGTFRRGYVPVLGVASAAGGTIVIFEFGERGRPVILRGTAQGLAVNLGGVTIAGGTFDIAYEWFEI